MIKRRSEYIAKAIAIQAEQLEQIIFADFTQPQAELLANRLSRLTGLEKLFFSDNGSTAVEVALKMARQWWKIKGTIDLKSLHSKVPTMEIHSELWQ